MILYRIRIAGLLVFALARPVWADAGESAVAGLVGQSIRLSDGGSRELRAPKGGALVVVFCSGECPISNAYSPTLNALVAESPAGRLVLLGAIVDPESSDAAIAAHAKEYEWKFPSASDRTGRLSSKLGIKVTPEVVVIDDRDRVRYRGRIDDRFASRGKANANPSSHELKDAIDAVLAGRDVAQPHVAAVGCPLPELAKPGR
jgi:AhpC/TSA family